MNEREVLAAADAVFDAERALRRAADTVDELGDLAASSLRVLDDAATDAFYAHQEERRDFYLESAGDHLARLRNRSGLMNELGEDLTRHLAAAGSAIERAGDELARGSDGDDRDMDVRALRTQIDILTEVVTLARPVAQQIARHAEHAAESAAATDALMLLDSRVHHAGQEDPGRRGRVDDALGDRERTVAGADLSGARRFPQLRGHPHEQPVVVQRSSAADPPARQAGRPRHRHLKGGSRPVVRSAGSPVASPGNVRANMNRWPFHEQHARDPIA